MDILRIAFDGWQRISITTNWLAIIVLVGIALIATFVIRKTIPILGRKSVQVEEATLGIGNNSLTLKFDRKDQEIAYKLWVELSTRKIGIPYDEENDVIVEVYNSWYSFFGIARELLKEVPENRLAYSGQLVDLTQKVLNDGLRPHLTKWQAKYRRWYDVTYEKDDNRCPQEYQKGYEQYQELIEDLILTNKRMIEYKELMHEIAFSK